MPLTITDQDTIDKINKLASDRHVSPEEVVRVAVSKEQPAERELTPEQQALAQRIMRLGREFAKGLAPDNRTDDEIIGYDENGLPA